jgi:rfaE bifunctional protein kinase chain/domain
MHPWIKDWQGAHLLVAGEVGIDEYLWGDTRRISPEAPVPVVEVEKKELKLGLGANVAQNITSLGGKVTLVSVRGDDADGKELTTLLSEAGIKTAQVIVDSSRPTLRKVRVLAQKQHVVRIDYEKVHPLEAKLAKTFNESICDQLKSADGIIVQDYGKGLWNPDTMGFVTQAKQLKKPIFVDPNRNSPASLYRGTTLLTPNTAEAEILAGFFTGATRSHAGKDDSYLTQLGKAILEKTSAEHVVITCGEYGMILLSQGKKDLLRIPTFARDVSDVTGAGDTVISVLSLAYVSGKPLNQCMEVANAAAGIVVGRIGASTVTPDELTQEMEHLKKLGLLNS